jgi:two-component system, NtrC family, C4-dicarboxylate transport sensor histidine kinase DctB
MKLLSKKTILTLFAVIYAILCWFYWNETRAYAENESFKKIQNVLFTHRAIHGYIEDIQKPAIYKLKTEGNLYKEYFAPEILSFTFITRNIKDYYNKERVKAGQNPIYFKLASSNPRNKINQATDEEAALIKRFNNEKLKEYRSVTEENGSKYLYYALPVQPNQTSCMKCHGEPNDAPKELVARYGDKAGFYEEMNKSRAIISVKAPLAEELKDANHIFWILSFATFTAFGLMYAVIAFFINRLEKMNQTLSERVEKEVQKRVEGEQILIQQSKMAAMGEMIGAISHQWKQPLNSLGLMTQDIKYAHEYGELDKAYIEEFDKKATEQIRYMSKTIDDFKNFFKPDKNKDEFCINDAIENSIKLIESQMKNNSIAIQLNFEKPHIFAFGNKNEFSQAFINILSNAKDAVIEKQKTDKLFGALIKIDVASKNNKITISIQDNGGGINKEVMDKIFEPYITTKQHGTGIGLYMTNLIIKDGFDGGISAKNQDDGAIFTITLDEFTQN